ncbi:MAG: DUF11 domain-containing protein [Clostridiales bacterium]|jgi:uncharacterized repeat protein (TIGR01451 family)|nr:DUF11 domain-containing protein [Clostridiales bacterium]
MAQSEKDFSERYVRLEEKLKNIRKVGFLSDYADGELIESLGYPYKGRRTFEQDRSLLISLVKKYIEEPVDSEILLAAFGLMHGYEFEKQIQNRRAKYYKEGFPKGTYKNPQSTLQKNETASIEWLAKCILQEKDLASIIKDAPDSMDLPLPQYPDKLPKPALNTGAVTQEASSVIQFVSGELTDLMKRLEELYYQPKPPENNVIVTLPGKSSKAGWGPARDTFTKDSIVAYPVFNSMTDNPDLDDERKFVRIAEVGTHGHFADTIEVVPGREYEVYIAFHNNGFADLNRGGTTIAQQVRLATTFPAKIAPDSIGVVSAIISASNTNPLEVWDGIALTALQEVHLHYKAGSAKISINGNANGKIMPESLFSANGTYLGINQLDGLVPAGRRFAGHVMYTLVAEILTCRLSITAKTDDEDFSPNISVTAGQEITYKVVFENTGNTTLKNVTFRTKLPDGMTFIPGSAYLYNNVHPDGVPLSDAIYKNGVRIGSYGQDTVATLTYKANVCDVCKGTTNLSVAAYVFHEMGQLNDKMFVAVN